jgi:hypothetical protein
MFIPNSMLKRLYILKEEINSEVIVVWHYLDFSMKYYPLFSVE